MNRTETGNFDGYARKQRTEFNAQTYRDRETNYGRTGRNKGAKEIINNFLAVGRDKATVGNGGEKKEDGDAIDDGW